MQLHLNTQKGPSALPMPTNRAETITDKIQGLSLEKMPNFGCTSFRVPGQSAPSNITARSMEFPLPIPWSVVACSAGAQVTSPAPNNQVGLSWSSVNNYVGFGIDGVPNLIVEGLNDQGLSASAQSLDATTYPTVPDGQNGSALAVSYFISWILGNFSTCAQVEQAIGNVIVWGNSIPGLGTKPLHFALSDAQWNNAVIEFVNGQTQFYNNGMSVLTNDPPFPFHVFNIALYNNQHNTDPGDANVNWNTVPTQYSTGSYGLPGGYDAVSRFVQTAWAIGTMAGASGPLTNDETIQLAWHLLNRIDRPAGPTETQIGNQVCFETTQWAVVRDHTNLTIDIRTYSNPAIYRLGIANLLKGMAPGQTKARPISALIPAQYTPESISF